MTKKKMDQVVALQYEQSYDAPIVVAKGKGIVAQKIIETAKQTDVPILEDPSLLELLGQININEEIPEDLYRAVAEIFAFIYQIDREKGGSEKIVYSEK